MNTPDRPWLETLQQYDRERSSFPGEHALTLGAGAWLLLRGGRGSWLRPLALVAGAALVARGLSGRDGPLRRGSLDGAPGRDVTVADGEVVASTAEPQPLDGGAAPPWPEDGEAEGLRAQDQLARDRAAWPF